MTSNNNNNAVVINTPPPNSGTPRLRRTQSVTPVRLFPRASTSGQRRYNSNNENSFIRNATNNIRPRRLNFNNNGPGPSSPGRKPKAVNVSKYEKMLKNLENKNKNKNKNKNNKPNNENKNVVAWLNKGMGEAKKINIPKDKRVFLLTDMTNNGKIKHVWDRRFLNGMIESDETLIVSRRREVRENNDQSFTSPLTRKKFSKNDIKAYPPTNATKRIIKQIMNGRALESKVNKFMKIKNRDYLARSNILETIKRGIRKGDITTEKQIKELALIYEVTGRELLISGHKKDGDYYTAYVKGKFEPHHMKFMKDTPYIAAKLYDTTRAHGSREAPLPARAIVPLYKLPEEVTKYLSGFDKYASGESPVAYNINLFIIHVLRQIVRDGHVLHMRSHILGEIRDLKNARLRNQLSKYYNLHETVKNAAS